jgi:hypothetical protein
LYVILFSCPRGFTGNYCHIQRRFQWQSWVLVLVICVTLSIIVYTFVRYSFKLIRLKYLFSHHRLQEQIGLEINSTNVVYSHLPTSDTNNYDRPLEDVLLDENEIFESGLINNKTNEFVDDPFYIDEKQPIFNGDRNPSTKSNTRSTHTGIL